MTTNHAHRRRLIGLMKRKENLELREVLQTLAERRGKLDEAQVRCRNAQGEFERAELAARALLAPGAQLDIAIQRVTTRSLVDRRGVLSDHQRSVERLIEAVDGVQRDVALRRARIHKLDQADKQAAVAQAQGQESAQANENDAIWLSGRRAAGTA